MTELDDSLPPGEQHILNELTEAKWAHERSLLEWKALYAGEGKEPSERQMYEDVKKVLSSDTPADDVLPTVEPAELVISPLHKPSPVFFVFGVLCSEGK